MNFLMTTEQVNELCEHVKCIESYKGEYLTDSIEYTWLNNAATQTLRAISMRIYGPAVARYEMHRVANTLTNVKEMYRKTDQERYRQVYRMWDIADDIAKTII